MTPDDVYALARSGIITLLWVTGPIMTIALVVGLVIALFQALTSIQEVTLTFVPKILIVFIALIFLLPPMAIWLTSFTDNLFVLIRASGQG